MTIILAWILIGILNFIILSYDGYKRYNDSYKELDDLYITLLLSLMISPVVLIAIIISEIKRIIKRKDV